MLDAQTAELTVWSGTTQFTIPGASAACTAIAMICARVGLNNTPTADAFDFPKVIKAGALAWKRWKDGLQGPRLLVYQHWKDVVTTVPVLMRDIEVVHENNGFVHENAIDSDQQAQFDLTTLRETLDIMAAGPPRRSAVLTINNSSYAFCYSRPKFTFYDSHGQGQEGAYTVETSNRDYFVRQLQEHFKAPHEEFSVVVLQRVQP